MSKLSHSNPDLDNVLGMHTDERAEFEQWASQYNLNKHVPLRDGNSYFHRETAIAFEAWQACKTNMQTIARNLAEELSSYENGYFEDSIESKQAAELTLKYFGLEAGK